MVAALAAEAAAEGRTVLAVDAVGNGGLDRVVAASGLAGRFETLRLTTRESLDQYLKIYLKLPIGPSRLAPLARIFDYVSAAAPGVREILTIGKVGHEVRTGAWDDVIVDGPATGHVVELLNAPRSMAELVPTGPLASQTGWLSEVLSAPSSGVVLVTTAEELPVTETTELLERLTTETATAVTGLIVNKLPVPVGPDGRAEADRLASTGSVAGPVAALACHRDRTAEAQWPRIDAFGLPAVVALEELNDPVGAVRRALSGGSAGRRP